MPHEVEVIEFEPDHTVPHEFEPDQTVPNGLEVIDIETDHTVPHGVIEFGLDDSVLEVLDYMVSDEEEDADHVRQPVQVGQSQEADDNMAGRVTPEDVEVNVDVQNHCCCGCYLLNVLCRLVVRNRNHIFGWAQR